MKPIEEGYRARRQNVEIHLDVERGGMSMGTLNDVLGPYAGRVRQFVVQQGGTPDLDEVTIVLVRVASRDTADLPAQAANDRGGPRPLTRSPLLPDIPRGTRFLVGGTAFARMGRS